MQNLIFLSTVLLGGALILVGLNLWEITKILQRHEDNIRHLFEKIIGK